MSLSLLTMDTNARACGNELTPLFCVCVRVQRAELEPAPGSASRALDVHGTARPVRTAHCQPLMSGMVVRLTRVCLCAGLAMPTGRSRATTSRRSRAPSRCRPRSRHCTIRATLPRALVLASATDSLMCATAGGSMARASRRTRPLLLGSGHCTSSPRMAISLLLTLSSRLTRALAASAGT